MQQNWKGYLASRKQRQRIQENTSTPLLQQKVDQIPAASAKKNVLHPTIPSVQETSKSILTEVKDKRAPGIAWNWFSWYPRHLAVLTIFIMIVLLLVVLCILGPLLDIVANSFCIIEPWVGRWFPQVHADVCSDMRKAALALTQPNFQGFPNHIALPGDSSVQFHRTQSISSSWPGFEHDLGELERGFSRDGVKCFPMLSASSYNTSAYALIHIEAALSKFQHADRVRPYMANDNTAMIHLESHLNGLGGPTGDDGWYILYSQLLPRRVSTYIYHKTSIGAFKVRNFQTLIQDQFIAELRTLIVERQPVKEEWGSFTDQLEKVCMMLSNQMMDELEVSCLSWWRRSWRFGKQQCLECAARLDLWRGECHKLHQFSKSVAMHLIKQKAGHQDLLQYLLREVMPVFEDGSMVTPSSLACHQDVLRELTAEWRKSALLSVRH